MKPTINWIMHVAVISDRHAPRFASFPDSLTFRDLDGNVIVYTKDMCEVDLTDEQAWLLPLAALLKPEFDWVRLDPDADVIEGLHVFQHP